MANDSNLSPYIRCNECGATLLDQTSPAVSRDAEGFWIARGRAVVDAVNAHRSQTGHAAFFFTMRIAMTNDEYDELRDGGIQSIHSFPSKK